MSEKIERIKTSLQIEEDIDLHVTGWIFQRIGWLIMLSFLICAGLGLFGNGPLSKREVTQGATTLVYERYYRHEADTEIQISTTTADGEMEVVVPGSFTKTFEIERIVPEPAEQNVNGGFIEFVFPSEGEGVVTFFVRPREWGSIRNNITVNNTDFEIDTFIYP